MFISSTLDKPGEKNQTETNDHHSAQKSAIEVQILAVIVCNLLNTPWMDFHIAGYIIPNISWINHTIVSSVHIEISFGLIFHRLNLFRIPLQPSRAALSSTMLRISQMWISRVYGNWFKMKNH